MKNLKNIISKQSEAYINGFVLVLLVSFVSYYVSFLPWVKVFINRL
ncbi:hypothetical protein [Campylobacter upsaliensis]|nr:hypothetical protein [Campylobacter upsaliensis]MCR2111670.1 hypothetical protein [Campylobacter upsaliensis]